MNWLKSMTKAWKKTETRDKLLAAIKNIDPKDVPFQGLTVEQAVEMQLARQQAKTATQALAQRQAAAQLAQAAQRAQAASNKAQQNITASQLQQLAQSLQGASGLGPTVSSGTMHEDRGELMREYADKMPRIVWPVEWDVRAIPPFAGAMVRYTIRYDKAEVSVYFDADNSLGVFQDDKGNPAPYWEVHPYDDDVYRVAFEATGQLVDAVQHSITQQQRGKTK